MHPTRKIAAAFVQELNQIAATVDYDEPNNLAEAVAYAASLSKRLHSRSVEGNERLDQVSRDFLGCKVGLEELIRTAEEHCFIYGITKYASEEAPAAPLPETQKCKNSSPAALPTKRGGRH